MAIRYRKALEQARPYPPGKPIEEVQREYGLEEVIKLASNENLYGPSRKALQKIRQILSKINYYPDANVYYLTQALAKKLGVSPANLLFSNGTDEMILLIALTFFEPSDNIVISENAFIRYQMAAQVMGIAWKSVPMREYCHDVDALLDAVDENTKAIFIDNPNNPLGTAIGKTEIEHLLDRTPERVLVVIDEAYREFVQRPDYHFDSVSYISRHKNLVLLRTFSKIYGLAGLRIGYAIADESVLGAILRVKPPFNVNSLAQGAALAAIDDEEHIRRTVEKVSQQKRWLYKKLKQLGLNALPSETNFITIDIGDSVKVAGELMKRGVIVRPLAGFGLREFIRVTIGRPRDNKLFIEALEQIISNIQNNRGETK